MTIRLNEWIIWDESSLSILFVLNSKFWVLTGILLDAISTCLEWFGFQMLDYQSDCSVRQFSFFVIAYLDFFGDLNLEISKLSKTFEFVIALGLDLQAILESFFLQF